MEHKTAFIITTPDQLEEMLSCAMEKALSKSGHISGTAEAIEIINTEQLCRRLDISPNTAITYRKKGKIPFLLIGDCIRYNWPAVVKALQK